MKVQFYPDTFESDIFDVPDDITEDELNDMACEWVADNIPGFWRVIEASEILEDGTLIVKTDQYDKVRRVLVENGTNGTLYYADTFSYHPVKEPPVVGIYRNCSDISWCCEDCKYDNLSANDYPCRMCTGDTFNAFEPMQGWAKDAEMRSEE